MPKGWFGPKAVGFGATPKSWEGWLATVIFLAVLLGTGRFLVPSLLPHTTLSRPIVLAALWVPEFIAYLALIRATYDPDA